MQSAGFAAMLDDKQHTTDTDAKSLAPVMTSIVDDETVALEWKKLVTAFVNTGADHKSLPAQLIVMERFSIRHQRSGLPPPDTSFVSALLNCLRPAAPPNCRSAALSIIPELAARDNQCPVLIKQGAVGLVFQTWYDLHTEGNDRQVECLALWGLLNLILNHGESETWFTRQPQTALMLYETILNVSSFSDDPTEHVLKAIRILWSHRPIDQTSDVVLQIKAILLRVIANNNSSIQTRSSVALLKDAYAIVNCLLRNNVKPWADGTLYTLILQTLKLQMTSGLLDHDLVHKVYICLTDLSGEETTQWTNHGLVPILTQFLTSNTLDKTLRLALKIIGNVMVEMGMSATPSFVAREWYGPELLKAVGSLMRRTSSMANDDNASKVPYMAAWAAACLFDSATTKEQFDSLTKAGLPLGIGQVTLQKSPKCADLESVKIFVDDFLVPIGEHVRKYAADPSCKPTQKQQAWLALLVQSDWRQRIDAILKADQKTCDPELKKIVSVLFASPPPSSASAIADNDHKKRAAVDDDNEPFSLAANLAKLRISVTPPSPVATTATPSSAIIAQTAGAGVGAGAGAVAGAVAGPVIAANLRPTPRPAPPQHTN